MGDLAYGQFDNDEEPKEPTIAQVGIYLGLFIHYADFTIEVPDEIMEQGTLAQYAWLRVKALEHEPGLMLVAPAVALKVKFF